MKALPPPYQPKGMWQKVKSGFKALFFPHIYTVDSQKENIERQIEANYSLQQQLQENTQRFQTRLEESRQQFELTRLKIQYFMQLEVQTHQSRENQLNREHQSFENQLNRAFQAELSMYMKKLDHAMMQEKMAFELFLFEERKKLDLEMRDVTHNLQLKLAVVQGQIVRQTEEYKRTLDRYPWGLPPSTILGIYSKYQDRSRPVPPLVILSPPTLEYDRFINASSSGLPKMEKQLAEDVRNFLSRYYPDDSPRPALFIGGIWETKARHSENAVMLLFSMFSSVPTLIFECETEGDFLNFRVASWDIGQELYKYKSILSKFNCIDFLYTVTRFHAREWRDQKAMLLQKGRSIEELKKLGGDDEINLGILENEEGLWKEGYERSLNYKITSKAIQELVKHLRVLHCIFIGLSLDEYYFMRYNIDLQLPKAMSQLIMELPDYERLSLLEVVTGYYKEFYEVLKDQDSPFLPEFALDVVDGLAGIIDKVWLKEMLNNSMRAWLKLRKEHPHKKMDLLSTLKSLLTRETDKEYVKQLYHCLLAIGEEDSAEQVKAILERWQHDEIKEIIL